MEDTRALNETATELLGIEARIDEFAETVQPFLGEVFEDYGLKMIKFSIAALDIDDDVLRRRYDEIGMDAIAKLRNAQADRGVMDTLGNDWGRQQAVNILGTVAANEGAGGLAAAGAGLGLGIGAGGVFAGMAHQTFNPVQPVAPAPPPTATTPPQGNTNDLATRLRTLGDLLNQGLITQAEYETRRAEIISQV